jgi:hypothetical protein
MKRYITSPIYTIKKGKGPFFPLFLFGTCVFELSQPDKGKRILPFIGRVWIKDTGVNFFAIVTEEI